MSNDINENKDALNPQNQTNSLDNLVDILATGIIRLELRKQEKQKIEPQTTEIKKQENSNENSE